MTKVSNRELQSYLDIGILVKETDKRLHEMKEEINTAK
jgi:hypothetical protein